MNYASQKVSAALVYLALGSCQNNTSEKAPEGPPRLLAPVSAPTSAAAALVVAPTSEPASMPEAVKFPKEVRADARFFYLDILEDAYGNLVVTHPDPAMQKKLNELLKEASKGFNQGCDVATATTALFSFLCVNTREEPNYSERAFMPYQRIKTSTHNYVFIGGELLPLALKDIAKADDPALVEKFNRERIDPSENNFIIDLKDGIVFFDTNALYETLYEGYDPFTQGIATKVDWEKDAALLEMESFPLATLAETEDYVEDFSDEASLLGELKAVALEASALPEGLVVEGRFLEGAQWSDALGAHSIVLSELEKTSKDGATLSKYLYANLYNGPTLEKIRLVIEKEEKCAEKNLTGFAEGSFLVTDLDRDQIAEVSLAYRKGCASTEASTFFKLVLVEGSDKYNLRGETGLESFTPSYTFPAGPWVFLNFATKRWEVLRHFSTPAASSPAASLPVVP